MIPLNNKKQNGEKKEETFFCLSIYLQSNFWYSSLYGNF